MSPAGALAITAAIAVAPGIISAIVAGLNWPEKGQGGNPTLARGALTLSLVIGCLCIAAWVSAIWMTVQW